MATNKEITPATYLPQTVRAYQGIPTIEALPPILNEDEVIERLTCYPRITEEDLAQPPEIRKHLILNGLSGSFYQPLEEHVEIESLISTTIRQGYTGRNPLSDACKAVQNQLYLEQMGRLGEEPRGPVNMTALGATIIGLSGVGKSSAIESVLGMYPQAIRHTEYNHEEFLLDQVVWVKIDCPDDGSVKALCHQFFDAMDMALGTDYFKEFARPRQSEHILLTAMKRCAFRHQLGLLVVDEIQHLNTARSGGVERMLNYFVTLVNTIGVPVLMVGTPMAERFIPSCFRQARRANGKGGIRWERMKRGSDQWEVFTASIWDCQWIAHKVERTKGMTDALYDSCQGIAVIAVGLFEQVQLEAIRSEKESFEAADFAKALQKRFFFMTRMIKALKDNDQKAIAQYEDISFKILIDVTRQNADRLGGKPKAPKPGQVKEMVVFQLGEMGILPEKASFFVEEAASAMGAKLNQKELLRSAFALALSEEKGETPKMEEVVKGDLRGLETQQSREESGIFDKEDW